ncbi:hypothetical protein JVT61DRAFT_12079 [Boletus reticuloceps]|uniref:Uncharacterized protein n=1 Tax=Boletus reticuloceps TaxID=495285 RepID=A0A8I3A441_9AGAM|nr:hypothetical protein JVT61DRAFT_12079 [Boletus reticuloceps]
MLEIEWELHMAEAHDALNECRHQVRVQAQLLKFKDHNLRGQGANTRAHKTLCALEQCLSLGHAKYSRAHEALTKLGEKLDRGDWQCKLRLLKPSDLRLMGDLLEG